MLIVNIHEAKTHLSRLIDRASKGEPFIIAKAGKPMVKVVPLETPEAGYDELAITGEHAVAVAALPPIHKDPFDRLVVAQSAIEGILLLTTDTAVARYPGPVRLV